MEVAVRELKTHLSAYLARVQAGETLLVTSNGKPVARLEPIENVSLPPAVEALHQAGRLHGEGRPVTFGYTVELTPGESISEKIVAERERD